MVSGNLKKISIDPIDILNAVKTIPNRNAHCCRLFKNGLYKWLDPALYISWAKTELSAGDAHHWSSAISHSKRAACCVIDRLLLNYHQKYFLRDSNQQKITRLNEIGVPVPNIIYELIIDPRNNIEHYYAQPEEQIARRSIDLAELFLKALNEELEQESIVSFDWNICHKQYSNINETKISFEGFAEHPMLLIDIFQEPEEVKIIDPKDGEVRFASLQKFDRDQSLELAKLLHQHYKIESHGRITVSATFFKEIKKHARI